MNESARDSNNASESKDPDVARAEYPHVVGMVHYEGQMRWTVFGIFLVAQTVLLGFIAGNLFELLKETHGVWVIFAGCGLGILLTPFWLIAFSFYTAFFSFRIAQGRELEDVTGFSIYKDGKKFGDGDPVEWLEDEDLALSWCQRKVSGTLIAWVIVGFFVVAYVGIGVVACLAKWG